MKTELAIISTEYLYDFFSEVLKDVQLDIDYTIYTYSDFDNLAEVYRSIPKRIKGVITSGIFPTRILQESFPNTHRVIATFGNDDAGIYRLFLQLLNQNRELDINRVYADVIDLAGLNLEEYLFGDVGSRNADLLNNTIRGMSLKDLIAAEKKHMNKHLELWQRGQIDISVTRFSSIADTLTAQGLNVYFPYPSKEYIQTVCFQTIQEMHIKEFRSNQPGAIIVSSKDSLSPELLRRTLLRLNTDYQLNASIQPALQGFELLTNRSTIESITETFTTCRIQSFFQKRDITPIYVGYGIGTDLHQTRINAIDANREARQLAGGASSLINEQSELISPLHKGEALVIPRLTTEPINHAAHLSGLSKLTIQKVITALETTADNRITSQELARLLSITQRSANRYLSALQQGGFATVVDQNKGNTMGRPERVYCVTIK